VPTGASGSSTIRAKALVPDEFKPARDKAAIARRHQRPHPGRSPTHGALWPMKNFRENQPVVKIAFSTAKLEGMMAGCAWL